MFASQEGFSDQSHLDKLYHDSLKKEFSTLSNLQKLAQKRKTAYLISGAVALLVLLVFVYYFKLLGLVVALLMIVAGYFTLRSSQCVVGEYQTRFKRDIISPIAKLAGGFVYKDGKLSQDDLENAKLFAPSIKKFASWDLYEKEGAKFSYIHVVFDTKENASLERMAENIFEGFLIMIDKKNANEGVLVSELLRDKVADMDLRMSSFFAKGRRDGSVNGFDIYGRVDQVDIDKDAALKEKKIAISYQKDKTTIALFHQSNPLSVDIFKTFDLTEAKHYQKSIEEIARVIEQLQ